MWQSFIYNIALFILAILIFPKLLYQVIRHRKYCNSFTRRFGWQLPFLDKQSKILVWLHCVSFGETKAMVALAKKIKQDPNILLIVSSITETGYDEAKKSLSFADAHLYLPLDFSWIIRPVVQRFCPDIVLVAENDLWPNFLRCAKEAGASIAIVNGKISERTYRRLERFPIYKNWLFQNLDLICVQNIHYADHFKKLNISVPLVVTGNLKLDHCPIKLNQNDKELMRKKLAIGKEDFVLVAGSTHHPEEELLLDAFQQIRLDHPYVKLILVPRHPERFEYVAHLIKQRGVEFCRYSDFSPASSAQVTLVDAMGVLQSCYQMADLAFIGGSFTEKIGGHNIIEPSWFGVPVFFGPYMHSQFELLSLVKQYQAGLQISSAEIGQTIRDLLLNVSKRIALGQGGLTLVASQQGATERTSQALSLLVEKKTCHEK